MAKPRVADAALSIIIILILMSHWPVSASIGVSGSILQKTVNPGQNITHVMTVELNKSDQPMDMEVEVMGFGQTLSGGYRGLSAEQDTSPFSARPFLNVSPDKFHIEPGTSEKVILTGTVPLDVGDGTRYALVNIRSLSSSKNRTVGVAVAFNVPVALKIRDSEFKMAGEITNLSVSGTDVAILFKNIGNTNYNAMAAVVFKDEQGNVAANVTSPLTFSSIIPEATRLFGLSLKPENRLKPGEYTVNATVALKNGTVLAGKEIRIEITPEKNSA